MILILGNKLTNSGEMNPILINRLDLAAKLHQKNNYQYILVSGGRAQQKSKYSEAHLMKKYLVEKYNIDNNIIIKENHSRDTIQNAKKSLRIVKKLNQKDITIVSSKFHLPRVKAIFNHFFDNKIKYYGAKNAITGKTLVKTKQNEKKYLQMWNKNLMV